MVCFGKSHKNDVWCSKFSQRKTLSLISDKTVFIVLFWVWHLFVLLPVGWNACALMTWTLNRNRTCWKCSLKMIHRANSMRAGCPMPGKIRHFCRPYTEWKRWPFQAMVDLWTHYNIALETVLEETSSWLQLGPNDTRCIYRLKKDESAYKWQWKVCSAKGELHGLSVHL
jgi:hypothetical protein